jgi:F-type H+-transporting ATPase subunit a
MRRVFAIALTLWLTLPATALASTVEGEEEDFDPSHEWELHDWIPIHLGPLNLSVNKAVAYLILASVLTILIGWLLMRWRLGTDPDRRQTVGEWIYEITQTQIAEQGLPTKAISRWYPYVASLALFIWVVNVVGFIPLPLSDETFELFGLELPTLGIYAATSTLSVTLTLALMTFVFTHVEGIRANGPIGHFKNWIPDVPKAMYPLIVPLEVLGQFMRLISLSVRLYANMLAGHMLILVFISLIFLMSGLVFALTPLIVVFITAFYLFELLIVVSIQAYIFAALSAIYIGSAIEPEH